MPYNNHIPLSYMKYLCILSPLCLLYMHNKLFFPFEFFYFSHYRDGCQFIHKINFHFLYLFLNKIFFRFILHVIRLRGPMDHIHLCFSFSLVCLEIALETFRLYRRFSLSFWLRWVWVTSNQVLLTFFRLLYSLLNFIGH